MRYKFRVMMLGLVAAVAVSADAQTQEKYPSRPIEMIIPTAAGGGTDISMRMLAELAEPLLGQKIVVSNKPGGGGGIGMVAIIRAKPDGYTIGGLWNSPLTMTPHLLPMPYTSKDYTAVTLATWAPIVQCVKTAFPASTGKEFIEELRKNPDKYTYGNDGVGGTAHLSSARVFTKLDVKARAVPFNGAGETLKAFLGGHVDIYAGSIAPIQPYVKDKSAKCLVLTSPERNAAVPDAASLTDLGAAEDGTLLWRGIIVPNGMPADRMSTLGKAFIEAAKSEKFQKFMEARGEESKGSSPAELRKLIDSEFAAMEKITGALGLKK
jgi:tripartite-type tricarboxylate transporter receptor subunit TctC